MSGLANMKARIRYLGGTQEKRNEELKVYSLKSALKNSYQSELIQILDSGKEFRCLINPDKIRPDYDNKIISILNESELSAGDTFHWINNDSYWIVYLQELVETAYFRGFIRKCNHSITVDNNTYYLSIQGPKERNLNWSQDGNISWNELNSTIDIYVKKDDITIELFKRNNSIDLLGRKWKVIARDDISLNNVLEVTLREDFTNSYEDLEGTPVITPVNTLIPHIEGSWIVNPYQTANYEIKLASGGVWEINTSKAKIVGENNLDNVEIEIISGKSGSFDLVYNRQGETAVSGTVYIESL